jgi:hypothetical protein
MGAVIQMNSKREGRPRSHYLSDTPLGRWVLRHFKGSYLHVARDLGIDISALEKMIKGELNMGADFDSRFWTYIEQEVCPVVAEKIGLKTPTTFTRWANGSVEPSSSAAKVIKYFSEMYTPEDPLDLDALIDYRRKNRAA